MSLETLSGMAPGQDLREGESPYIMSQETCFLYVISYATRYGIDNE